ncbi:MAG: recombination protein RecR [uncultured bacterium]|nr:MAG: recombination protein RecR [uncultured bacterium]KKR16621.1 MAG: Recombination protein RecR [Candidatus Levybacteria bacterium GW2011_GWA1_39_34]KKR51277.1 MAG: Recombination protein RecR [Candidatus Levybacteria bacterium GW2011_GWC1_40_19]KKR73840.1 MAG: Recombination protein RecR [Candidatus Levybacteria bacterium GW2011_GWC2_40_7]KKR94636.1 MAG: Recombination protein RecR [Candidatus Levybacteria bacterium GW2011_GWA2_41_15]KKS02044.1 MAG: Recombination protein RecR [Candidatus Lev
MKIPKAVQNLVESFEKLPGVGQKTAQRLTFYLLHVPQSELDSFARAIGSLKNNTLVCSVCLNIGEKDPCDICSDTQRNKDTICVVEQPLDVLALEKNGKYQGVYHVLHGKIDPLNNIGPDEIYIGKLLDRIRDSKNSHTISEVIIATNPTMEGEATAMYITKQIKSQIPASPAGRLSLKSQIKITRIGRGLPVGSDIEYADEVTLQRAMEGRQDY